MIFQIRGVAAVLWAACSAVSCAGQINVQDFNMKAPIAGEVYRQMLLPDEIAGVEAEHLALTGPLTHAESLSEDEDTVFLFIKGRGSLSTDKETLSIVPETIALPIALTSITIEVAEGDTLHCLCIRKQLSDQDRKDMEDFAPRNAQDIYFTKFRDCQAYTEKIKSPKTVSRTVLPKDHVPRLAMGTVETSGPDRVGAHEHPMLDQLFLGLSDNDIIVHADDAEVRFGAYSLLHIPLGSSHWVEAEEGRRMYYMWMDFFLTKEGQEWLKTHQHVERDKD